VKTKLEKDEKLCRSCKRILPKNTRLGLCPTCLNKYGTRIASGIVLILSGRSLKTIYGKIKKDV
jgi:RNA polymerase subunit RPABC4/transcription elongation factor Spt4